MQLRGTEVAAQKMEWEEEWKVPHNQYGEVCPETPAGSSVLGTLSRGITSVGCTGAITGGGGGGQHRKNWLQPKMCNHAGGAVAIGSCC